MGGKEYKERVREQRIKLLSTAVETVQRTRRENREEREGDRYITCAQNVATVAKLVKLER
jgi:hypothetical protein